MPPKKTSSEDLTSLLGGIVTDVYVNDSEYWMGADVVIKFHNGFELSFNCSGLALRRLTKTPMSQLNQVQEDYYANVWDEVMNERAEARAKRLKGPKKAPVPPPEKLWRQSGGVSVALSAMQDSYILNCIALLDAKGVDRFVRDPAYASVDDLRAEYNRRVEARKAGGVNDAGEPRAPAQIDVSRFADLEFDDLEDQAAAKSSWIDKVVGAGTNYKKEG